MSVKWPQNHWLWFSAFCGVGGVVALSPGHPAVERHGRAVKAGRPQVVERHLASTDNVTTLPQTRGLELPLRDPRPPVAVLDRSPSFPTVVESESFFPTAIPFAPLDDLEAVTLSLPDRVDPLDNLPPISNVTFETKLPEVSTQLPAFEPNLAPATPLPGSPVINPGPRHHIAAPTSAIAPIRLRGIVPFE